MKIKRGITVRPYVEKVSQKTELSIWRPALKDTRMQNPAKPTRAMATPTGIPKRNKTASRMTMPERPTMAGLIWQRRCGFNRLDQIGQEDQRHHRAAGGDQIGEGVENHPTAFPILRPSS